MRFRRAVAELRERGAHAIGVTPTRRCWLSRRAMARERVREGDAYQLPSTTVSGRLSRRQGVPTRSP
ncbi:hypothetical protein HBB16_20820 [Pseudonocardia sp. MCCB 268]|nr:hypothetical protein [Pseudonocardia cytotoxica]